MILTRDIFVGISKADKIPTKRPTAIFLKGSTTLLPPLMSANILRLTCNDNVRPNYFFLQFLRARISSSCFFTIWDSFSGNGVGSCHALIRIGGGGSSTWAAVSLLGIFLSLLLARGSARAGKTSLGRIIIIGSYLPFLSPQVAAEVVTQAHWNS